MRVLLLSFLLASAAGAQEPVFQFAQGPWRTDHALIGVLSDGTVLGSVADQLIASDDGGLSWDIREGVAVPLAIVEHEGELIGAFGAEGIRRSTDGARSWGALEAVGREVRFVASGGGYLYAASDRAVFGYAAESWSGLSAPVEADEGIRGVAVSESGALGLSVQDNSTIYKATVALRSRVADSSWQRAELGACPSGGVAVRGETFWFGRSTCYLGSLGLLPGGLHQWLPSEDAPRQVLRESVDALAVSQTGEVLRSIHNTLVEVATGRVVERFRVTPSSFELEAQRPLAYSRTAGFQDPPSFRGQVGAGIEVSIDGQWAQVGVIASGTRQILLSEGRIFASTDEAVFEFVDGVWTVPNRTGTRVRTLVQVPEIGPLALSDPDIPGLILGNGGVLFGENDWQQLGDLSVLDVAASEGFLAASFRDTRVFTKRYVSGVGLCPVDVLFECQPDIRLPYDNVRALHASDATVYAGASGPLNQWDFEPAPLPTPVWASGDGGQTWADDSEGLTDVSEAYAFASGDGEAWVGTDVGVFRRNESQPWTLDLDTSERIHVLERDASGALLAGGEGGLWRLGADGWAPYGSGLEGRTVFDIALDETDGTLALATDQGVWATRPLVTVDAETTPPAAPLALTLTAYPNPASGAVRITAVSPEAERVHLRVIDVLGREVANLGEHASGAEMTWSDAVPAGLYIVRAESASGVAAVRVTRLR